MKKEKKKSMKRPERKVQLLSDTKLEKLLIALTNRYHSKSFKEDKDLLMNNKFTEQQQNKVIATWDLWSKKIKQNSKDWDEKQELMMAVIETMIEKGLHEEQPINKRKRI